MQFILILAGNIVGNFPVLLTEFQSCILPSLGVTNRCMSVDGVPCAVYTRASEELCRSQFLLLRARRAVLFGNFSMWFASG